MKSETITVRIPEILKTKLENFVSESGISLSEGVRAILENYFNDDSPSFGMTVNFYDTIEFVFLVAWLYEKRFQRFDGLTFHKVSKLKTIVQQVLSTKDCPQNLKNELELVYAELINYCNDYHQEFHYFKFGMECNPRQFNYQILIDFVVQTTFQNVIYM